jgi:NADH dehydrogenase
MILVTGATGFIGRSLMACLAREGIEARPYTGYLETPLTLREAMTGIDTVIHLAGAESKGSNNRLQQVDIEGTENLLEECRRTNVQHLIFASRIGADTASMHTLLYTKGVVERLIQQSGIPYTILRSATLYGRDDRFTEIILALALWSWPIVWLPGGGQTAMQPLWVEDFVRCLLITLKNPAKYLDKTVTIAGEERIRYRDLVQQILTIKGKKRIAVPLPDDFELYAESPLPEELPLVATHSPFWIVECVFQLSRLSVWPLASEVPLTFQLPTCSLLPDSE